MRRAPGLHCMTGSEMIFCAMYLIFFCPENSIFVTKFVYFVRLDYLFNTYVLIVVKQLSMLTKNKKLKKIKMLDPDTDLQHPDLLTIVYFIVFNLSWKFHQNLLKHFFHNVANKQRRTGRNWIKQVIAQLSLLVEVTCILYQHGTRPG